MLPPSWRTRRHLQGRDKSRSKVPVPLKLKSWDVVFSGITNGLCLCQCGVFAIFAKRALPQRSWPMKNPRNLPSFRIV